ncbi:unnamed protein product [Heligmosomoides polygyrus]|uniref:SNF2_N domain-containing protein n=1 Tax=Heligmosomoides polygyrus TaxID=6339 RepID=A0A183F7E5_HELPZ|nr:unnamed protein product [Heligmosomoides polygyrus]
MLCFLGVFPYYIREVWEGYFLNPWMAGRKDQLIQLMSQLMWRNTKKDVADQLKTVQRKENLVELTFSPIEERLYSTKIEKCKEKITSILRELCVTYSPSIPLFKLPVATVEAMFSVVNDIRASILAGEAHKKRKNLNCISDFRIFSPKLIIRKLFDDARVAVVQRHREVVANRNALAGICMLIGDELGALK